MKKALTGISEPFTKGTDNTIGFETEGRGHVAINGAGTAVEQQNSPTSAMRRQESDTVRAKAQLPRYQIMQAL